MVNEMDDADSGVQAEQALSVFDYLGRVAIGAGQVVPVPVLLAL